ncbi:uncharacterized protein LOC110465559 [Mizuhopecten yessoensis]|uniref:Uncharacterized protein n=1 Tax=Mizuhopecten yessoensis TaxID=6573 RepID=A0A210PRA9_MIZYE|nr:uncharacterized protein LOC110465559 [Mizuhopecten yessoensis]OWF39018.1 hypothetical protein KP79_PYT15123 [Mizuhopecten yessoensis]
MAENMCTVGIGKLRKVALAYLQDVLQNVYNVRVKIDSQTKPFQSERELPVRTVVDFSTVKDHVCERLKYIFPGQDKCQNSFWEICESMIETKKVNSIMSQVEKAGEDATKVIQSWGVENELYVGMIPTPRGESLFEATIDDDNNRVYFHWDKEALPKDYMAAVTKMAQVLREKRRQPTPVEYFAFQLAYYNLSHGSQGRHHNARGLGTPGFRPTTQTYMSLTDPGEGHVLGTTRFNEWMEGAIVHVEHLERPRNLPRENIESYRIPSMLDFSKVRLHVGSSAPTTYFVGRRVKDSGNFDEDFLKLVNITAASATAAFYQGAAECKVSMEGLSTSQAVHYMQALRGQVQRNRKQFLSAAWNLNQVIKDDYDQCSVCSLKERMAIAIRAIEITSIGGFDKITWDGASDTYPSKCIMYQLTFEEALTIVHEAHIRGLVTYFSAGFKFNEIKYAVYAGVDGIGIGGAQVLRFMDGQTGMHGPYTEENIPRILESRNEAANSTRGRGVKLLARLDTMYFEGSITKEHDSLREQLFIAVKSVDESRLVQLLEQLKEVVNMPNEENSPMIGRARRLVNSTDPLLKMHTESEEEWTALKKLLTSLIIAKDEEFIAEEYESDPWLVMRKSYRKKQWEDNRCITRQTSFDVTCKSFY